MFHIWLARFLAAVFILPVFGQGSAPKQGADLLKTDILGVFAHPDDETGMAGTLAHYALGRSNVCVNVYCTRGEGGGNMVGTQWGESLGILREAELRNCLSTLGVRSCYFLNQPDWAYTESAAATLEKWGKEITLERLVRLVRSLRPEVIVTMNPAPTPGQHGHHQSAAILATEAFTAAANPARYPEQLSREGLAVWQARKLYYPGSNATHIAVIQLDQPITSGKLPGEIAAAALANHRSQGFGNFSNAAWLRRPQTFTLVKSFIPVQGTEVDLLSGLPVPDSDLRLVELQTPAPAPPFEAQFAPRPAFRGYQEWVQKNGIQHVSKKYGVDLPLLAGEQNEVWLELKNNRTTDATGEAKIKLPDGWTCAEPAFPIRLAAGKNLRLPVRITPPRGSREDGDVRALLTFDGAAHEAVLRGHLVPVGQVPRLATAPVLGAIDGAWQKAASYTIASTNLAEGRTTSPQDSSAVFRIAHTANTLYLDILVTDDHVISNIAPNDIRGHWRSDSVEICLDPSAGAEHTLGSFKLGIFPFDSVGNVRAARDADANQGPVEETSPGTRIYSARTPDGYRVQAAIPLKDAGLSEKPGTLFGFNLIIYDGDKTNAAPGENINKSRIAWSPRPGVQGRPEDWGRLRLQ